jgi:hypothetical protein
MQQRRRSKLTCCNASSGVSMFFASNEEGTFLEVFYSSQLKAGKTISFVHQAGFKIQANICSMLTLIAFTIKKGCSVPGLVA